MWDYFFEHYRSCCFSKFQCNNLVPCHHKCAVVYVSATVKPGAASATLVLKDSRSRLVVSMARAPVDRYKAETRRTSKKLFSTRSPACLVFSTGTCLLLLLLLLLWCCFASDSVIFKPRRDHQPRQTSRKEKIDLGFGRSFLHGDESTLSTGRSLLLHTFLRYDTTCVRRPTRQLALSWYT